MTMKKFLLGSTCCFLLNGMAFAEETADAAPRFSLPSVLSMMGLDGANDALRWQVAPSYSDATGWGVGAAVGGFVSGNLALGVEIELGEGREEILANAAVPLGEKMRIMGSVGLLREDGTLSAGGGRGWAAQSEYGLSLKGDYDAGFVRGFELNGYATEARDGSASMELGDVKGVQAVTRLQPAEGTDIRLGAGYEWLSWAGGTHDGGVTLQLAGTQRLSDTLDLQFDATSAETGNAYGLGLNYDLSTPGIRSSALKITLDRIDGKHGIGDDTRVAVTWTVGFGAVAAARPEAGGATVGSMGTMTSPDLIAEVMTRPAFLPRRVVGRATADDSCGGLGVHAIYGGARNRYLGGDRPYVDVFLISNDPDLVIDENTGVMVGGVPFYFSQVSGAYHQFYTTQTELFADNGPRDMQLTIGDTICAQRILGAQ